MTGTALKGIGNALANTITGNALNNRIDGMAGVDTLIGGQGDDVYVVDSAADRVIEFFRRRRGYGRVQRLFQPGEQRRNSAADRSGGNQCHGQRPARIRCMAIAPPTSSMAAGGNDDMYGGIDIARDVFVFAAKTDSLPGAAHDRVFRFRERPRCHRSQPA
ncbi:hypothetical protein ACFSTD_21330 [Novosphingobium colocasiae]